MRIAALVKPVPAFPPGPAGRPSPLALNPFCARAVAQAYELAAAVGDGTVTVCALGGADAVDVVRGALAGAGPADVSADGVVVCDAAFEGSDTLATARALAAAIAHLGGFDLVLTGRNAVDVDTGQVGPQLAELLGLPFAAGARYVALHGTTLSVRCEQDDGWTQLDLELPAVVSCAERLIDPPGAAPDVGPVPVRTIAADQLGPGPWGAAASRARVGARRARSATRERVVLEGSVEDQARAAVTRLRERGALAAVPDDARAEPVPPAQGERGDVVGVALEPARPRVTRELLGVAARLAFGIDGHVVAVGPEPGAAETLGGWGADAVVRLDGVAIEEDVAGGLVAWARAASPWAVLAPGTWWGREVAARTAARLDAGLVGDAVAVAVGDDRRLEAWKRVEGGQAEVAVTVESAVQLATLHPGAFPTEAPRAAGRPTERALTVEPGARVRVRSRTRDDDLEALAYAETVVGVGLGVERGEYRRLGPLLDALGAELAATRPVVDRRFLPHARQVGWTGRSIAPRLYVAVGLLGAPEHLVGVGAAGTVLGVHPSPGAPLFDGCDVGIVGDWRAVVPALVAELAAAGVAAT